MGLPFVSIFALLCLGVVGSCRASMPAELYWKSVLPNTPMPKSLQDLRSPVNKSNFVKVNEDGFLNFDAFNEDIIFEYRFEYRDSKVNSSFSKHELEKGSHLPSNVSIFFFESDLHPGRLMKLPGFITTNQATFLPRAIADSMPFSSNNFSDILKLVSVDPKSTEAKKMKQTIEACETACIKGEDKYCTSSLESLLDQSVSRLGKKVQILSTEVEKETKIGEYSIGKGVKNMGEMDIVCHKKMYPYAVFYCHSIKKTDVYRVTLVGSDGTKVKTVAVCHKDTSAWDPRLLAFQLLKVKPGSVPICHFLGKETVVWVSN